MQFGPPGILLFVLSSAFVAPPMAGAKACSIDVLNQTDAYVSALRLYDQNDRYLGRGGSRPIRRGERYVFSRERMISGEGAWPDRCEGFVILRLNSAPDAASLTSLSGDRRACRLSKMIAHEKHPTLGGDTRNMIVITSEDLSHPGHCKQQ